MEIFILCSQCCYKDEMTYIEPSVQCKHSLLLEVLHVVFKGWAPIAAAAAAAGLPVSTDSWAFKPHVIVML